MKLKGKPIAWEHILPQCGCCGILGRRGEGKTALAYYLAELRHQLHGVDAVVYGPPVSLQEHLPSWITIATELHEFARVRDKTLVLDEGSLPLHARRSLEKSHTNFDTLISLSRQRRQLFITVTHHARKLDPLVVMDWDLVIYKMPSGMHTRMERGEIRELSAKAREALSQVSKEQRRQLSYVFYEDLDEEALVHNPLPSFWNDQISVAVAAAQDEEIGKSLDTARQVSMPVQDPSIILDEVERIRRLLYQVSVDLFEDYKDYREKTPEEQAAHVSIAVLFDREVPQEAVLRACADTNPDSTQAKRRFGRPLLEEIETKLKQCLDQIPGLEELSREDEGRTRLLSPWVVDKERVQLEGALKTLQAFLAARIPGEG